MKELKSSQMLDGTTVVATANYPFTADFYKLVGLHAIWTATTASFSIKLQYSGNGSTWEDFTSATAITNADGSVFWATDGSKDALYWRVLNTRTSGTLTTLKLYAQIIAR